MRNEKQASAFRAYQKVVNEIGDFFEYHYLTHSVPEIKEFIDARLDRLTDKLEKVYDGK